MPRISVALLYIAILTTACSKKNFIQNTPANMPAPLLPYSQWNIPIFIPLDELNRSINILVSNNFRDGFTIEDRLKITTSLAGDVKLQAAEYSLLCELPLQLEILPIGALSNIKAHGQLELQLRITFDIFQNTLLSKTEIQHHRWIKTPVIKFFAVQIPFSQIADKILNKYKTRLAQLVDDYIAAEVNLNRYKKIIQNYLQQGLIYSEDKMIQCFVGIQEISLAPLIIQQGILQIPLTIYFESVIAESKPTDLFDDLLFNFQPAFDKQSVFTIQSRIPLPYLEQLLRTQIEKQEFDVGISKLYIRSINLTGSQSHFLITLETEKAYNGTLQIVFSPNFDMHKKAITLENFQLTPLKGKKLEKTLVQWFHAFISNKARAEIEQRLNDFLRKYVDYVHHLMNGTSLWPGSLLSGQLADYSISQFTIYDNRLYFNLNSRLTNELRIDRLNPERLQFDKF